MLLGAVQPETKHGKVAAAIASALKPKLRRLVFMFCFAGAFRSPTQQITGNCPEEADNRRNLTFGISGNHEKHRRKDDDQDAECPKHMLGVVSFPDQESNQAECDNCKQADPETQPANKFGCPRRVAFGLDGSCARSRRRIGCRHFLFGGGDLFLGVGLRPRLRRHKERGESYDGNRGGKSHGGGGAIIGYWPLRASFSLAQQVNWSKRTATATFSNDMPAIGITGGISTGKTSFVVCLRELVPGARFFDADATARELADRDPEVRGLIGQEFGPEVYSGGEGLNRARVRAIVFGDAAKKRALEQILHPRIRRQWSLEAERHRNSTEFFFADIPLLYETGGETLCDRVVVVACSPSVQLERLMRRGPSMEGRGPARPGSGKSGASRELRPPLDEMSARRIIEAQLPLTEKMARADHVVWNNGGRDGLEEQARLLVGLWIQR